MAHSTLRTLLVAALFITAGCQGLFGTSGPPSDQRAVDALGHSRMAAHEVTSYRLVLDGQVQIRHEGQTESVELSGDGVVNVNRQRMNLTVSTRGNTGVGVREAQTAYLDGYTLDMECSRMGWARYNLTESTRWLNYTTLGQHLALLDRTNVYWNGTETIDGAETAVVTAHPTQEQFRATQVPPETVGTRGDGNFQNATVRVWIDAATGRIRKAQREVRFRGGDSTAVATVTYRFSAYNDPTNVTRPAFEESGAEWKTGCPGT